MASPVHYMERNNTMRPRHCKPVVVDQHLEQCRHQSCSCQEARSPSRNNAHTRLHVRSSLAHGAPSACWMRRFHWHSSLVHICLFEQNQQVKKQLKQTDLVQGGEGVRQAEAVHRGVREAPAVHAGHDPVHDDRPRRRVRLEQARAALRGHVVDAEQGGAAAVCIPQRRSDIQFLSIS